MAGNGGSNEKKLSVITFQKILFSKNYFFKKILKTKFKKGDLKNEIS